MTLGIVGKIPTAADFIRVGTIGPVSQRCFRWLGDAVAESAMSGIRELLKSPMGFLVHTDQGSTFGVMTSSTDSIGRLFPLVLVSEVPTQQLAASYPNLPVRLNRWLQDALQLLQAHIGERGTLEGLQSLAQQIATHPDFVTFSSGAVSSLSHDAPSVTWQSNSTLTAMPPTTRTGLTTGLAADGQGAAPTDRLMLPAALVHQQLFGEQDRVAKAFYAYRTLGQGCKQASGGKSYLDASNQATCVLDCPITEVGDTKLWLTLIHALRSPATGIPTLLWTMGSNTAMGRLVVSFGPPPFELFAYLEGAHQRSSKFWPLQTESPRALAQALESFPSSTLALEGTASAADLRDAVRHDLERL